MMLTPDLLVDDTDEHAQHCHCIPLWLKVIVPLIAAAFISFVVMAQLKQIKQLTRMQELSRLEIAEIQHHDAARTEDFARLRTSMLVRNDLFTRIAVNVGVPEPEVQSILAKDPMAPPAAR